VGAASAQPPNARIKVAPPAVFAINGVIVHEAWTDEQIEGWVFGDNASEARQRLDSRLAMQILDLDRACQLTDAQKTKLRLAGRGDIKRFFDRFDEFKRKVQFTQHDAQKMQRVFQEIPHLQALLQLGLFHEDSLLVKSLRNTLSAEQFARYEERRALRHRENVLKAVHILEFGWEGVERDSLLREDQRRDLIALITHETRPSRRPSPYDPQLLLLQLGRLPEEKLKRLFDQNQWGFVSQHLAGCEQLDPILKQAGLLPAEGDGE
jgi:hypothetical protein